MQKYVVAVVDVCGSVDLQIFYAIPQFGDYCNMVLCVEPQKIYSPRGCHKIAFLSIFSHNWPTAYKVFEASTCTHCVPIFYI
jgi:hypothetical protein